MVQCSSVIDIKILYINLLVLNLGTAHEKLVFITCVYMCRNLMGWLSFPGVDKKRHTSCVCVCVCVRESECECVCMRACMCMPRGCSATTEP